MNQVAAEGRQRRVRLVTLVRLVAQAGRRSQGPSGDLVHHPGTTVVGVVVERPATQHTGPDDRSPVQKTGGPGFTRRREPVAYHTIAGLKTGTAPRRN